MIREAILPMVILEATGMMGQDGILKIQNIDRDFCTGLFLF